MITLSFPDEGPECNLIHYTVQAGAMAHSQAINVSLPGKHPTTHICHPEPSHASVKDLAFNHHLTKISHITLKLVTYQLAPTHTGHPHMDKYTIIYGGRRIQA